MNKIINNLTQATLLEEKAFLHSTMFNVNIRLLKINKGYKQLIKSIIDYMNDILNKNYNDYSKLKGISGANVGIPFNIVVSDFVYMINPIIINVSKETYLTKSNCGSLLLPKPIQVKRYKWIEVEYFDINGVKVVSDIFMRPLAGTIQHEIEHNNGILITDK